MLGEDLRQQFLHWFTVVMLVVIVVGGLALAYPRWCENQELQRQEQELQARIKNLNDEIARLKDYQRRFRDDPDFIESIARQNRRVFPGELVFIFND